MANDYQKQYVDLRGGLDFSSSPLNASPGSLSQCLNFETTDYIGVKRIDGFERFDGTLSPSAAQSSATLKQINCTYGSIIGTIENVTDGMFIRGDFDYSLGYAPIRGVAVDVYIEGTDTEDSVIVTYLETFPNSFVDNTSWTAYDDSGGIAGGVTFTITTADGANALTVAEANAIYTAIRDVKGKFKQSRIAHGLHYFKERLWAVVDFESILVQQTGANAGVLTAGVIYPGDVVYNGSTEAVVLDVKVLDGSWAQPHPSNSAIVTLEAKLLVRRTAGTSDPLFANNTEIGIKRNSSVISSDVMTVKTSLVSTAPPTWAAGLYYSQSESQASNDSSLYGWQQYAHPWEFTYKDGNPPNDLPPVEFLRKFREAAEADEDESTDTGYNAPGTGVGDGSVNTGFVIVDVADLASDDGTYEFVFTNAVGQLGFDSNADLTNFSFGSEIPEDAIITGVEVKIVARKNAAAEAASAAIDPYFSAITLLGAGGTSENKGSAAIIFGSTSDTTYTLGGQYDKWGLPSLGATEVRDSTFGVRLSASLFGGVFGAYANQEVLDVEQVNVKVYFTKASTTYYFWNGSNDVSAKVLRVHTAKGAWSDPADPAQGTIIVTDVTPATGRNHIQIGDQMRTAISGGGDLVCTVTSNMVVCATASLSQIIATNSRFQTITSNFYGDATWNAMYSANGAGRAFSFDGVYFQKIFTGLVEEKDKPRHVRSYKTAGGIAARLALGFPSGNVTFSVEGEPENFRGVDGAASIDVGNRVNGLANMQGTTLGVFCESAIYGIQGLGNDSPLVTLKPKGGAIEYTIQEVGSDVLYCDVYGIHSLQQSDLYGDFAGTPVSYNVNAWLQPRLRKYANSGELADLSVVHNSMSVRTKNQYRLWAGDGYVLSLTFRGPERTPEFTIQRYSYTTGGTTYTYVPIALCSEIDETGRERRFMSHFAYYAGTSDTINSQDTKRYVFELDTGWSFDGNVIPCSFTPYYNFFDQKFFDYKILRKITAYGLSRNVYNLTVYTGNDFEPPVETNGQSIAFTRASSSDITDELIPQKDLVNVASRGVCSTIKFVGSTTTAEPAGIVQGLLLQYMVAQGEE